MNQWPHGSITRLGAWKASVSGHTAVFRFSQKQHNKMGDYQGKPQDLLPSFVFLWSHSHLLTFFQAIPSRHTWRQLALTGFPQNYGFTVVYNYKIAWRK